ncbi:MAG: YIP1 family protein [Bacteroidetes bacterium]|nr:YIP1 family protein [Bacteroidota bacterium]
MSEDTLTEQTGYSSGNMSSVPPQPDEAFSISDKLVGILTEPSLTFENVRAAGPRASDWIVPVILTAAILAIGMFLRFSNPEMMADLMQQQTKGISERVESGDITQEQADAAMQQMRDMSGIIKVTGTLSAAVGFVIVFFFLALLYWVILRYLFKGDVTFGLVLSAAGLSTYISAIDQLLSLALSFITGETFASFSPALLFDSDMTSLQGRFLAMLGPITIWTYFVLGIGFEKVARISRMKGMITAFGMLILFTLVGSLAGMFAQ